MTFFPQILWYIFHVLFKKAVQSVKYQIFTEHLTYVRQYVDNEFISIIRYNEKQTLFPFSETFFPKFEAFAKHSMLIRIKDIILRRNALTKEAHNVLNAKD